MNILQSRRGIVKFAKSAVWVLAGLSLFIALMNKSSDLMVTDLLVAHKIMAPDSHSRIVHRTYRVQDNAYMVRCPKSAFLLRENAGIAFYRLGSDPTLKEEDETDANRIRFDVRSFGPKDFPLDSAVIYRGWLDEGSVFFRVLISDNEYVLILVQFI